METHKGNHYVLFQFTPLREGRHVPRVGRDAEDYFNSRPSARGDLKKEVDLLDVIISIHAPPRGATSAA